MSMALFAAVESCDQWRAKFLLNKGVRINLRDPSGEHILVTALYIDNDRKRNRMFRWLVSKGADIMTVSKTSGRDILMWAAYLNCPAEAVLVLNDAGGELDLKRKDFKGYTALHYATMNDCSDLVDEICRYLRRYDISVDMTDSEGMTPYLLARRLGNSTCAHILMDIGQACPYKGDEKTGQSQHFWETLGGLERTRKDEAEKSRVVALYKRMGRLPQLIKAGFDTDHIKLVSSQNEKRIIEEGRKLKRHGTLEPLNLASFDPDGPVISSKLNIDDDNSNRISSSLLVTIHQQLETDSFFANEYPQGPTSAPGEDEMGSPRMMSSILDLLSEQSTHTFKTPAKKPKPRGGMVCAAHATAFGMRLKRKATSRKDNHRLSRDQGPSSAVNKDPLPIIVQN